MTHERFDSGPYKSCLAATRSERSLRVAAKRCASSAALCVLLFSGCHHDMQDQPRYDPLEGSELFSDGLSARPLVPGTVARGHLRVDEATYAGRRDGQLIETIPLDVTEDLVHRGQERYNIFCSPCHSRVGDGQGMIVLRGYRKPPSFHSPRLRGMPDGHFFDVMTRGFGVMPSYASQVPVEDRWAITAYLRALQLSQHASLDTIPDAERSKFPPEVMP